MLEGGERAGGEQLLPVLGQDADCLVDVSCVDVERERLGELAAVGQPVRRKLEDPSALAIRKRERGERVLTDRGGQRVRAGSSAMRLDEDAAARERGEQLGSVGESKLFA